MQFFIFNSILKLKFLYSTLLLQPCRIINDSNTRYGYIMEKRNKPELANL